jgi:hypothetical protein
MTNDDIDYVVRRLLRQANKAKPQTKKRSELLEHMKASLEGAVVMRDIPPWPPYDPFAGSYRTPRVARIFLACVIMVLIVLGMAIFEIVHYAVK